MHIQLSTRQLFDRLSTRRVMLFIVLAAVMSFVFGVNSGVASAANTGRTPAASNGTRPHEAKAAQRATQIVTGTVAYWANKAPKGSYDFGPDVNTHVLSAVRGLFKKAGGPDPLFAALNKALQANGDIFGIQPKQVMAAARSLAGNKAQWRHAIYGFLEEVKSYEVKYDHRKGYTTFQMVPHKGRMPALERVTVNQPVGLALFVTLKNGNVLEYRIKCHFQPVAVHEVLTAPTVPSTPTPARLTVHRTPAPPQHKVPPARRHHRHHGHRKPPVKHHKKKHHHTRVCNGISTECKPIVVCIRKPKPAPKPGIMWMWSQQQCRWIPCHTVCVKKPIPVQPGYTFTWDEATCSWVPHKVLCPGAVEVNGKCVTPCPVGTVGPGGQHCYPPHPHPGCLPGVDCGHKPPTCGCKPTPPCPCIGTGQVQQPIPAADQEPTTSTTPTAGATTAPAQETVTSDNNRGDGSGTVATAPSNSDVGSNSGAADGSGSPSGTDSVGGTTSTGSNPTATNAPTATTGAGNNGTDGNGNSTGGGTISSPWASA